MDVDELIAAGQRLAQACERLEFSAPVAYVYNPLVYAWSGHEAYLHLFERTRPTVLLVGMNPGPFGMLQTGVPFGDVVMVRDWLGVEAVIDKPPREHPKRLVEGFANRRREVSGSRVWGWAKERYETPQVFCERFFVANYCPLGFFDADGRNLTPDKLPRAQQEALGEVCDAGLRELIEIIEPQWAVGIGRYAENSVKRVAEPLGLETLGVTHPSPANPHANRGWTPHMDAVAEQVGG